MTKDDERIAAKDLFMLGRDQKYVARVLKVSQATVSKWANDDNWREERSMKFSLEESRAERMMGLIDYQIEALEANTRESRENLAKFQKLIKEVDPLDMTKDQMAMGKLKLIEKGEIDALSKLFATIRGKDMSWSQYVNVTRELIEFISARDNDLAKMIVEHTDAFLLHKRDLIVA